MSHRISNQYTTTSPTNTPPRLPPMSHLISNQSAAIPPTNQPPYLQPISHRISNQSATASLTNTPQRLPSVSYHIFTKEEQSMITIALVTQIQGNVSICKYTSGGKPFRLLYEIEIRTTQSEFSNFWIEYLDETYIFENIFTYL